MLRIIIFVFSLYSCDCRTKTPVKTYSWGLDFFPNKLVYGFRTNAYFSAPNRARLENHIVVVFSKTLTTNVSLFLGVRVYKCALHVHFGRKPGHSIHPVQRRRGIS